MRNMKLLGYGLLSLLMLAVGLGCSSSPTPTPTPQPERIADEVARQWAEDSAAEIGDAIAEALLEEEPLLRPVASAVVEAVLERIITWSFSSASQYQDALYDVIATASVETDVDIPLLGAKTYVISLPFTVRVDTSNRTIRSSRANILDASVRESES